MKQLRLALAVAVATLATSSALAASLTMIQFGSFETRAEAEKRLAEIASKHAASIGKLATTIREVKLPPDNLTVYRTQAGPIESRAAAQTICSQLASKGDECYIVQTAITAAEAAKTPAKVADAAGSATTAATEPVASALAEAKVDALSAATPAPDLTSKLSTLQPATTRDPLNRAALAGLSTTDTALATGAATAGAAASAAAVDAAAPEAAQVNKALDEAVAKEAQVEADLADVKKTKAPSRRSFWSRINPFSEAPAESAVEAPAEKAVPEAAAAVLEPVAAAALPASETAAAALPAAVVATATADAAVSSDAAVPSTATPTDSVPQLAKAPITLDTTPVITYAEPLPLPPPPAPLKARDRELLAAATKPVIPAPEPVAFAPVTPATALPAGSGSVQVEEARRVPVTSATTAPATQAPVAQAVPTLAPQAIVPLSPSATEGIKALWAQIGPFANNEAALAYWANYRQQHPDFPVVRVRVVSSYQQQVRGFSEAWLRVGPVAQAAFVRNLCSSLGPANTLRCGMVRDLGTSSPLGRTPGQLPTSRYKR